MADCSEPVCGCSPVLSVLWIMEEQLSVGWHGGTEMREEGVTDIIKFGIAFSGKFFILLSLRFCQIVERSFSYEDAVLQDKLQAHPE